MQAKVCQHLHQLPLRPRQAAFSPSRPSHPMPPSPFPPFHPSVHSPPPPLIAPCPARSLPSFHPALLGTFATSTPRFFCHLRFHFVRYPSAQISNYYLFVCFSWLTYILIITSDINWLGNPTSHNPLAGVTTLTSRHA